jgi:RHS repeat-associated protein
LLNTYTEYTYNVLNRLVKLSNKKVGEVVLSSYDYTLGPTGNRTRIIENTNGVIDTLDYIYDNVYRLLNEKRSGAHAYEITYEYDKVGNRMKKIIGADTTQYVYNNRDQLLHEILGTDTTSYDYDDNGNTIKKTAGAVVTDYEYDYDNRLIQALENSEFLSGYTYDADGNRITKQTKQTRQTRETIIDTVNYVVDPNQALAQVLTEYDNSGAVIVSYLHGDDLISQNRGGVKSYYHYDGLGSTRLLTDTTGLISDKYAFYAFGLTLYAIGTTPNAYLFTGEQFDPNLGFYYLRARLYNPTLGRFLTTDPFQGSIYDPTVTPQTPLLQRRSNKQT